MMKTRFLQYGLAGLLCLPASLHAASYATTYPMGPDAIPDGNLNGRADVRTITEVEGVIQDVNVFLDFRGIGPDGGWNGDIYASLQHGSGYSVLLNRVGRAAGRAYGSTGNGFEILLDDSAAGGDIHQHSPLGSGEMLSGIFAPDGRNLSPIDSLAAFEAAPRSALLDAFVGLPVAGDWTLLVIDASSGGTLELREWGLRIDYDPAKTVPEPLSAVWLGLIAAGMAAARHRSAKR